MEISPWASIALNALYAAVIGLGASSALAQTVADLNGIPLKPWVEFVQPYLTAAATVLVPILIAALAQRLSLWLGVSMNATQVDRLKSAAATEAGAIIAQASDNLSAHVIHTSDPRIVAAATAIVNKLPDTAAAVGATPDALARMVQGEIGKLQAAQPPSPPAGATKS